MYPSLANKTNIHQVLEFISVEELVVSLFEARVSHEHALDVIRCLTAAYEARPIFSNIREEWSKWLI